jgi:tRNA(Glu) U13 pseudouridine synthase TruD
MTYLPLNKECPFCTESIPIPIPECIVTKVMKLKNLPRNQILLSTIKNHFTDIIEQYEFCRLHRGELKIVPNGIKQNWPTEIDFTILPDRIKMLYAQIESLIFGSKESYYRNEELNTYDEIGESAARRPMMMLNRFEKFQVRILSFL